MLSDERNAASVRRRRRAAAIARFVPWTRVVEERRTDARRRGGRPRARTCARSRDRLVLKPNDDYGGKGIVLGWTVDDAEWDAALAKALAEPYIVQERVPIPSGAVPEPRRRPRAGHRPHDRHRARSSRTASTSTGVLTRLVDGGAAERDGGGGSQVPTFVVEPRRDRSAARVVVARRHASEAWTRSDIPRRGSIPMKQPILTFGIEEEYQIIDPETRELQSRTSAEILEARHPGAGRGEAGAAPVDRRGRRRNVCQHAGGGARGARAAARRRDGARRARTASRSPPPARTRSRTGWSRRSRRSSATSACSSDMQRPRAAAAHLRHARPRRRSRTRSSSSTR